MENLKLASLKSLILSGNNITDLEGLNFVNNLEELEMNKCQLSDLNNLILFSLPGLKRINFAYNKISLNYLDDLCNVLQNHPSIVEVDLSGNEITLNRHYKLKVLQFPQIIRLDKQVLNEAVRKHILDLKKTNDLEKLVTDTKKEYLERIKAEDELKKNTLAMIERQKRQVEEMFDEYRENMEA